MATPDRFTAADVRPVSDRDTCQNPLDAGYHWDCPRCGTHCYHRTVTDVPQTWTTPAQLAAQPLCAFCRSYERWVATHLFVTQ